MEAMPKDCKLPRSAVNIVVYSRVGVVMWLVGVLCGSLEFAVAHWV
jgi:hypothetical protein